MKGTPRTARLPSARSLKDAGSGSLTRRGSDKLSADSPGSAHLLTSAASFRRKAADCPQPQMVDPDASARHALAAMAAEGSTPEAKQPRRDPATPAEPPRLSRAGSGRSSQGDLKRADPRTPPEGPRSARPSSCRSSQGDSSKMQTDAPTPPGTQRQHGAGPGRSPQGDSQRPEPRPSARGSARAPPRQGGDCPPPEMPSLPRTATCSSSGSLSNLPRTATSSSSGSCSSRREPQEKPEPSPADAARQRAAARKAAQIAATAALAEEQSARRIKNAEHMARTAEEAARSAAMQANEARSTIDSMKLEMHDLQQELARMRREKATLEKDQKHTQQRPGECPGRSVSPYCPSDLDDCSAQTHVDPCSQISAESLETDERDDSEPAFMYIGRARMSLKNIIDQTGHYATLPLYNELGVEGAERAQLVVSVYPIDAQGSTQSRPGGDALLGERVDFVVHIIGCHFLPAALCDRVTVKYVFRWAEDDFYKTEEVRGATDPVFDFKKRFAFPKMNPGLCEFFLSDSVLNFEVLALAPQEELSGAPTGRLREIEPCVSKRTSPYFP
eukprot:TRINITY_DN8604_c0_g1_i1.p1 TRINITY_DN8604_c0_g1~~TRINITY_DN8604_c0_g1_i1.p1  ORF type:complete len:559 (+),score=115.92 TRINITY_DN8604_c0_g1_i1:116-1792(+)